MRGKEDVRFIRRTKNDGYLHRLTDDPPRPPLPKVHKVRSARPDIERTRWQSLSTQFQQSVAPSRLQRFAGGLGLTVTSLRRLRVGWDVGSGAWTFPMRDARGDVVGVRLRTDVGRKWAIRGSKEGLFIPAGLPQLPAPLAICEGPTDTAAALDLGFAAVGRPSCKGGIALVVDIVKTLGVPSAVVFSDNDEVGVRGAEALASTLLAYVREVRAVRPPTGTKDVREWVQSGATRAKVQATIEATAPRSLRIRSRGSRPKEGETGAGNGE
jgi:hypothetical protein